MIPVKDNLYRMEPARKTVNERLREENSELKRVLGVINRNTETVLNNEGLTRKRVEILEAWRRRGFVGRLKWLLMGEVK